MKTPRKIQEQAKNEFLSIARKTIGSDEESKEVMASSSDTGTFSILSTNSPCLNTTNIEDNLTPFELKLTNNMDYNAPLWAEPLEKNLKKALFTYCDKHDPTV